MRLLLDTHAMYWSIEDDPQLSGPARTLILDASNEVLISPASYWEIAIEVSLGRWHFIVDRTAGRGETPRPRPISEADPAADPTRRSGPAGNDRGPKLYPGRLCSSSSMVLPGVRSLPARPG